MRRLTPNAIKNVTPWVNPSPRGIDLICNSLQASFDALDWNEKSFSRAVSGSHKRQDESNYFFPRCFIEGGKDFMDMMPQDNNTAYSFMFARDREQIVGYNEGTRNIHERRLSCIFWMNLECIDDTRNNDFLEELKQDVFKAIRTTELLSNSQGGESLGVEILEIFDEPKNIFEGFTIDLEKNQALYYPYRGLRVDVNALYKEECN